LSVFLDTNILIYSISTAMDETAKAAKAMALLERDDCVLSVQVLQEFYMQATRASRPTPLPHKVAADLIRTWLRFQIQDNTITVLQSALEIKAAHGFSYWDSAILAAAIAAGCTELYTEDLSHGGQIGSIRIINPFRS
jgi:predicted nucleic acid-binding protein